MASVPNRRQSSNAVAAERSKRGRRASTSGARRGDDPALGVEPETAVESSDATASAPADGPKPAGEVASPSPAVDAIGDEKEMDDSTYDDEAEGEDKAGDATEEEEDRRTRTRTRTRSEDDEEEDQKKKKKKKKNKKKKKKTRKKARTRKTWLRTMVSKTTSPPTASASTAPTL